jgi:hypothetical protein
MDFFGRQVCGWIKSYLGINGSESSNVSEKRSEFIKYVSRLDGNTLLNHIQRFYNGLWLSANDVLFGISVGSLIAENSSFLSFHLIKFIKVCYALFSVVKQSHYPLLSGVLYFFN